ncbi:MAG TPA: SMI1/KNR4 family protein [Ktedonobacterales bacterium]
MTINDVLALIAADAACHVRRPEGEPRLEPGHTLPEDVHRFYHLCGGVDLFLECEYPVFVLPPGEVALANPIIVGQRVEDDRSDSWYLVAHDGNGDYLTLDCGIERAGQCYDSFHETHGLAGQTPIIAPRSRSCLRAAMTPVGDTHTGCATTSSRWATPTIQTSRRWRARRDVYQRSQCMTLSTGRRGAG